MPFLVTMMLADAAQALDNKLYILGGGWSIIGPEPSPSAVALHIKVPWDLANERHRLVLQLLDSDGDPVTIQVPDGSDEPLVFDTQFEVGRPAGLTKGTPIDVSIALNLPPLVLAPARRYEWRLSINGEREDDWYLAFSTRPPSGPS